MLDFYKFEGKCKGKKIEKKSRRKEEFKENKILKLIYLFYVSFKLICLFELFYMKIKSNFPNV